MRRLLSLLTRGLGALVLLGLVLGLVWVLQIAFRIATYTSPDDTARFASSARRTTSAQRVA